ncbi:endonuclease VIII [Salmonella enterica subsp. indica]|uniref:DNA-(apurinic or apyrimidinic site) lyase n=2 Tax=Salmonella enterica TaxID=28901 RepID=A0A379XSK4_SALER|nr:endonuclease VIII [Salmonella enterica subsp. indica]
MPEGPEIRRAADTLEAAVKGKPLTDVWFAFEQLKPYQSQLIGQSVTQLETRGKALLTHFSNGLTLYSHNQLYGVWRVVDTGNIPQTTRVLRVRLQTEDKTILLYSASDIEILTPEQLTTHPFLQRVGPDVLDMRLTPAEVKTRLLSPRFRNRQFSGLLLDQGFLAGLGNYLRVEILWQVGLTGQHKASQLNDEQLDTLAQALLDIPRLSYNTRGQVDDNKHHGALFRFKVFHRDGEACERCGGTIEKTTLSSRPFYAHLNATSCGGGQQKVGSASNATHGKIRICYPHN